jgi:hypothetical protein
VLVLRHTEMAGRAALAAAIAGIGLTALIAFVPTRYERGTTCPTGATIHYLRTLPKDAIIAGDPIDLKCVPATTRRAVVISTQLAPSYEKAYFLMGRKRMFDTLDAIYGPDPQAIVDLGKRYGATDLWIRRGSIQRQWKHQGGPWRGWSRPYGEYVKQLLAGGAKPASLDLPTSCRRYVQGPNEVYSISCVAKSLA